MGLDYIRKVGGSFRKSWNHGVQRLAAPDLYTSNPECATRAVLADLVDKADVRPKERLLLQCENGKLIAYRELSRVATVTEPPADLLSAIAKCGGYALGVVEKRNKRSQTVSIAVKE